MKALTTDRAVRRFLQIAAIEQTVEKIEASIGAVAKELEDAEERLKELQSQRREQLALMRAAAKDEGQLPLFDVLAGELEDLGVAREVLPPAPRLAGEAHA